MKKYTVYGLEYKEANELEKELSILIDSDKGTIGFYDRSEPKRNWKELEKLFMKRIEEKYNIDLPEKVYMFGPDGDQNFDFYVGFMVEGA